MPYAATLTQELTVILQQAVASSRKPTHRVTIDSTTPLAVCCSLPLEEHHARRAAGSTDRTRHI
jgi:hypothetical protein